MERKYKESPLLVPYKREMHDVIINIVCSKCVCLPQTVFGFILLLNIVTLKSILVWQLEASLIFYVVKNCKINYIQNKHSFHKEKEVLKDTDWLISV